MSLLCVSLITITLAAGAAPAAQTPSGQTKSEPVTLKATIEAIDRTGRLVTLRGPQGNSVTVAVDAAMKRFDQLNVGDVVTATYYESIAWNLRRPGDPPPPAQPTESVTARPGGPGATAARQQTITVTIESLDPKIPSVTVKGPQGRVISFRVRDANNLKGLKAGDQVDVTYTEALLLTADPAPR
jgi:hypothetical protein